MLHTIKQHTGNAKLRSDNVLKKRIKIKNLEINFKIKILKILMKSSGNTAM